MTNKISFKKIYEDDHLLEIKAHIFSGESSFASQFYEGLDFTKDFSGSLRQLMSREIDELSFETGAWGYGSGYIQLHFKLDSFGKVFISTLQQDECSGDYKKYAEDARFYLKAEPSSLEDFINNILNLEKVGDSIELECLVFPNKDYSSFKVLEPKIVNE